VEDWEDWDEEEAVDTKEEDYEDWEEDYEDWDSEEIDHDEEGEWENDYDCEFEEEFFECPEEAQIFGEGTCWQEVIIDSCNREEPECLYWHATGQDAFGQWEWISEPCWEEESDWEDEWDNYDWEDPESYDNLAKGVASEENPFDDTT